MYDRQTFIPRHYSLFYKVEREVAKRISIAAY